MVNKVLVTASPILLVLAGVSMITALDYNNYGRKRAEEGNSLTFSQYLGEIPSRMTDAAAPVAAPPTLAQAMPSFLGGWEINPYQAEDYDKLANIPPRELTDYEKQEAALMEIIANDPGAQMVQAQQASNIDREQITLTKGDDIMILSLNFRSSRVYDGFGGSMMSMVQENMQATMGAMNTSFATIQGVPFRIADIEESPNGRRIIGHMGKQADIVLYTNADDKSALTLLSKVNFVNLNAMLMEPLDTIDQTADAIIAQPRAVPASSPAQPSAPAGPVIRRLGGGASSNAAGNACRMENGVRRCSVGNN